MSTHHSFGVMLTGFRARKPGLTQTRLAELSGYAPAILVRMCQGKKDLTGPSGRERIVRIIGTLLDEGVVLSLDEVNALLAAADFPPLYGGLRNEAELMRRLDGRSVAVGASNTQRTNLAAASTSFIGRESEIEQLTQRIMRARIDLRSGHAEAAIAHLRQSLPVADELSVSEFAARSIELWSLADRGEAAEIGAAELARRRAAGDTVGVADMLLAMGRVTLDLGELEHAESLLAECMRLWDRLGLAGGEWGGAGWACLARGHAARLAGAIDTAERRYAESLRLHEASGSVDGEATALLHLGLLALATEHAGSAERRLLHALEKFRNAGMRQGVAFTLAGLSDACRRDGHMLRAERLAGAASTLVRDEEARTLHPAAWSLIDFPHRVAASPSDDWRAGRAMSIPSAIAFALAGSRYGA